MFGLFLLICTTGADICSYQSAGYIYPDYQNCTADIAAQKLPSSYECLPVDAVVRAKDDL
ncbi:Uncharacterised protein [Serratia entomophila]|nr:hypothetical protein [Serratia entomophila]HBC7418501.1 hypothetical protein [Serratia marcescens]UIW19276.1 hypothetical protein KHA73_04815 [Serratia entomophila]UIW19459.1 hypothetical protein KHA73_05780 [Serratia entomophila]CAI0821367.1 Uncharacterised protein [Serratia entomophila]CAI0824523.1 Uncharacterised protein [Serratia entomophila]